jgi:hypothetical protein
VTRWRSPRGTPGSGSDGPVFKEGPGVWPVTRLQTVGFAAITLHVSYHLVFTARKE